MHLLQILPPDIASVTFMQDGAPAHTANETMERLKLTFPTVWGKGVWPGNSPDLNPIENLWSILQDSIFKEPHVRTKEELIKRVKHEWDNVNPMILKNLVESFPKRIADCLA